MTDQFANYRARLAGSPMPTHAENSDDVDSGFYCRRNKDRRTGEVTYDAVAFYRNSRGKLRGSIAGRPGELDPSACLELWTWVSNKPIPEETFRIIEQGGEWPDLHPIVAKQTKDERERAATPAKHGSLIAADIEQQKEAVQAARDAGEIPPADPIAEMTAKLEELAKGIPPLTEIETDEQLAMAHNLRDAINKIGSKAEKDRKAEKEEHLRKAQAVDDKYRGVKALAARHAEALTAPMNAWVNYKAKVERERLERIRAEQEEHDRKAREAEAANKPPPPAPTAPPSNLPPPTTQIRSTGARTTAVRTRKVVTITDPIAAFTALQNDPTLRDALLRVATIAVNAGIDVPGTTHTEEARV